MRTDGRRGLTASWIAVILHFTALETQITIIYSEIYSFVQKCNDSELVFLKAYLPFNKNNKIFCLIKSLADI